MTEQAVTKSAAIEPPSVGRRTTGSGSSHLISSGQWEEDSLWLSSVNQVLDSALVGHGIRLGRGLS